MTPLQQPLTLTTALETTDTDGAAIVHDALEQAFLHQLRSELDQLTFEPLAPEEGVARQGGQVHPHHELSISPAVQQLGHELADRIHAHGRLSPGCQNWQPNEVFVQGYHRDDLGITPHLDLKRYHYLVAIVTAEGTAPFILCKNRAGDPLTTWDAAPGSLIFLRAPGLGPTDRPRPLHAVVGPEAGRRVSVSYRMDTSTH